MITVETEIWFTRKGKIVKAVVRQRGRFVGMTNRTKNIRVA